MQCTEICRLWERDPCRYFRDKGFRRLMENKTYEARRQECRSFKIDHVYLTGLCDNEVILPDVSVTETKLFI